MSHLSSYALFVFEWQQQSQLQLHIEISPCEFRMLYMMEEEKDNGNKEEIMINQDLTGEILRG